MGLICSVIGLFLSWPMHWNAQEIMKYITFLELISIMVARNVWGIKLYKKFLFYVYDLSLVSVINKQSSTSKPLMQLIRRLVLMVNSVKAKHIPYENSGSVSGAWHQWRTEYHHLFHRFIQLDLQNQIRLLLEASLARNTQMSYIIGLNVIQKIRSG